MIPADFANALNACKEPDWVLLGIIADFLEDHGDEMAASLRWAVRERKWPKVSNGPISWWHDQYQEDDIYTPKWSLVSPSMWAEFYSIIMGRRGKWGWPNSITQAFTDLHQMIVKSQTITTPERP